jgi:hypothetical protein
MPNLIGITGRKYNGKDTVARELALNGYAVVRFAGPLKDMLRAFYKAHGVDDAVIERKIEGDLKEHPCPLLRGKTPRYAMQTLGDEWGRQLISDDLWVESLAYRVEGKPRVVVPDVRYANEADTIARLNGEVWRVDAGKRVPENESSGHASETEVDTLAVHKEIDNNGTLFELSHAVKAALSLPA